jgi:hypothetical protein
VKSPPSLGTLCPDEAAASVTDVAHEESTGCIRTSRWQGAFASRRSLEILGVESQEVGIGRVRNGVGLE